MSPCILLRYSGLVGFAEAEVSPYRAYTILHLIDGRHEVSITGNTFIIPGNTLVFISHLEVFSIKPLSEKSRRNIVQFSVDLISQFVSYPTLLSVFRNRPDGFTPFMDAPDVTAEIFDCFSHEFTTPQCFSNELVGCRLTQLLIELFRKDEDSFPISPVHFGRQIEAVRLDIENRFTKRLIIADLAVKYDVSMHYLSHAFKALTGYSPKRFIELNQLSLARELLLTTNLLITDISLQCGFADPSSFTRCFSGLLLCSPREYRRRYRNLPRQTQE